MVKDQFNMAIVYAEQSVRWPATSAHATSRPTRWARSASRSTERGDEDLGIRLVRESLVMTKEIDRAHDLHRAYSNLSTALQDGGRPDEAYAVAIEGVEWAHRMGMWRLQGRSSGRSRIGPDRLRSVGRGLADPRRRGRPGDRGVAG